MSDDAREAKAEAKAAKARAKALRPWYRKKRYIGGIVLLVIIIAAVAGGGSADDDDASGGGDSSGDVDTVSGNTDNPPPADVELTECKTDDLGQLEATLVVTNHSSEKSSYIIEVTFESPDGSEQYDTSTALVNNLEPDQKKTEQAVTFTEPSGEFTCRVTDVNRFAS